MDTPLSALSSAHARVLVVDDHPGTAATLARALSQLGKNLEVFSAHSGEDALELTRDKPVDILITDMMMTGINGLELIEKLQAHPGGRPTFVMLVTAYDVPGLKITAHRLKVNEILIKPVRPERVCQLVSEAVQQLGAEAPEAKEEVRAAPKILIADDLPDNISLLARYLKNEGYLCSFAVDGEEALAKIRAEMPDLILLDMNMPVKDGLQTLQEIRSDPVISHLPVIILTAARIEPMDMQLALNIGADDYVTKPFDRRELLARIRTRLRVKESEDIIRRRNKELSLLPEIGRELSARTDVGELSDIILRRTVETLGAFWGHLILLEGRGKTDQKSYRFSAAQNLQASLPDLAGLLNRVQETRQGFIIGDACQDLRWPLSAEDATRSVLAAPLLGRAGLLGLLILAHEKPNYFLTEHLLLLQAIASQAAIAIENALLYENVAKQQKRLSAVLQSAAEAIFVFDDEGRLSLLNPTAEKLFTDFKASLDRPLEAGLGYDALINMLEDARNSGNSKLGEIIWPDKRTFMTTITPIESGGLAAILHDVTHFKDVERVKNEFI